VQQHAALTTESSPSSELMSWPSAPATWIHEWVKNACCSQTASVFTLTQALISSSDTNFLIQMLDILQLTTFQHACPTFYLSFALQSQSHPAPLPPLIRAPPTASEQRSAVACKMESTRLLQQSGLKYEKQSSWRLIWRCVSVGWSFDFFPTRWWQQIQKWCKNKSWNRRTAVEKWNTPRPPPRVKILRILQFLGVPPRNWLQTSACV
jgi:hypothetical protein